MKKIAVIGAGVAGLSAAQVLKERFSVKVFEKEDRPGGLIRCERVEGSLFHLCGGHVFNTKRENVLKWFWSRFDRENDFVKADRRSAVCLNNNLFVDYPIENHVYQLPEDLQRSFYSDIENLLHCQMPKPRNFNEFLLSRFGKTLYDLYFKPYNDKVWRRDLSQIPISWLDGKLPMPTPTEMLRANKEHLIEKTFVHSSFYYPKNGGSQFIADTLATGLNVAYGVCVAEIVRSGKGEWSVNGEPFDAVVFCGNVKDLPAMLRIDMTEYVDWIGRLESHGTTAVFCETDPIPYSWFYQPSPMHDSHRFICTGNFSPSNNASGKMTCTVEFTDYVAEDEIQEQLRVMPYHPKMLTRHYSRYSYPIQHSDTRDMIRSLRQKLQPEGIYLVGRFAEWEYYNMDAVIDSVMKTCNEIGSWGMC